MLVMCIGREIIFWWCLLGGREISVGDVYWEGDHFWWCLLGWREISVGDVYWEGGRSVTFIGRETIVGGVYWEGDQCW